MHERAAARLDAGLEALAAACAKGIQTVAQGEHRVGRLREKFTRVAQLFQVEVRADGNPEPGGSGEERWKAYIQLTEAEASGLAPAISAGPGLYPGVFPGRRALEDAGQDGPSRRTG